MSVFYKKNAMAILLSIILVYAAGCGQGNAESLEMNQETGDVTKTVNVQKEINAQGTAGEQEDIEKQKPVDMQETADAQENASVAEETSTEVKEKSDENISNYYEVAEEISAEEYENFKITADAADAQGYNQFDDFASVMSQDFTGTWYDPEMGEAIRITKEAAYVYIPFLDEYGDIPYEWEIIDRSDRKLCPELAIYISGRGAGPLAYYVGGFREDYFWCNSQMQIFYRQ